jgi:isatin hydrolase
MDGARFDPFKGCKVIDLSVTLDESLPGTWPGHFPYAHRAWREFGPHSVYKTHLVAIDEHCGTHFDAPPHFIPPPDSGLPWASALGLRGGDEVSLALLRGPAAVVDVRALNAGAAPGRSPWITAGHIAEWESANGPVERGEIVLLLTGWDAYCRPGDKGYCYLAGPVLDGRTPGWPAPDVGALEHLHARGVMTIGTDAPSLGSVQDGAPLHQAGLSKGMAYVEGLCHLQDLPVRGAFFIFLPLKIRGSTGCPGRATAVVPSQA